MSDFPVERHTLSRIAFDGAQSFGSVEVRRITIAPGFHAGAHWHNGPVFGVVESGSVFFQVGAAEEAVLRAGETFYEPADATITRFDATDEGVTFLAWFPVAPGADPELVMGPHPDDAPDAV